MPRSRSLHMSAASSPSGLRAALCPRAHELPVCSRLDLTKLVYEGVFMVRSAQLHHMRRHSRVDSPRMGGSHRNAVSCDVARLDRHGPADGLAAVLAAGRSGRARRCVPAHLRGSRRAHRPGAGHAHEAQAPRHTANGSRAAQPRRVARLSGCPSPFPTGEDRAMPASGRTRIGQGLMSPGARARAGARW